MLKYSNLGGAVMSQSAYAKVGRPFPNYQGHRPNEQPATTGWTAPTLIYDKMRQINMSAVALNGDVTVNVRRELFKGSWAAWFANWRKFFEKYQTITGQLGALTYTDELFQQTLSYESQLVTWYDAYGRERDGDKPLPPPSGAPPVPNVPIPPARDLPSAPSDSGLVVPWWAWAIGAVVVAGGAYATYLYVQKARAIRKMVDEKVVPTALQVYGGPAGGALAQGYAGMRDPVYIAGANPPGLMTYPVVASPGAMPPPFSRYPGT